MWWQRGVVGEGSIVVSGCVPRNGGCKSWRVDAGSWEHGGLFVGLGDDRGTECGLFVGSHCEGVSVQKCCYSGCMVVVKQ